MNDMKYLKIIEPKWAGYSGPIGVVWFKDAVSTEPWPKHVRDRVAAAVPMEEFEKDGEAQEAGQAADALRNRTTRMEIPERLTRQTVASKKDEMIALSLGNIPSRTMRTQDELEAIIAGQGVTGLRAVAAEWDVKGRSIPELLEAISKAQNIYGSTHLDRVTEIKKKYDDTYDEKIVEGAVPAEPVKAKKASKLPKAKKDAVLNTARTGDLSSALTQMASDLERMAKSTIPDAEPVGDLYAHLNKEVAE